MNCAALSGSNNASTGAADIGGVLRQLTGAPLIMRRVSETGRALCCQEVRIAPALYLVQHWPDAWPCRVCPRLDAGVTTEISADGDCFSYRLRQTAGRPAWIYIPPLMAYCGNESSVGVGCCVAPVRRRFGRT